MKALWLGLLGASCLHAAPPVIDAIYPAGGQRGNSVAVELIGKVPDEGLQFWASDPGIRYEEGKLVLSDDCSLGAHWVRFYNAEGSALPQLFVVGYDEERQEEEPNDEVSEAMVIERWPVIVNGQLSKSGESDLFAVELEKGDTFDVEVTAYRIDSPLDPLLRLMDGEGNVVAWNHDRYDSLDSRLVHTAIYTGKHYLMVAGFVYPPAARSRFAGSKETVYRLAFGDGSVQERDSSLELIGNAGEEDHVSLEAEKGITYQIEVEAQSLNSALDPWLEIRNPEGKVLAKNDDSAGVDALLSWKAPATETYTIALRDLLHQGGKDYHYKLIVEEAQPSYEVQVKDHAWTMTEGELLEIPVTVKRKHGHARPITVTLEGLPLSIDAQALTIPGKASEGVLRLGASSESMAVIRLSATDHLTTRSVYYPFKGATTDQDALLRNKLEDFLLNARKK